MPERTNFEVINQGQVTPQRLHALLRLIPRCRQPKREDLLSLLQPSELSENTKAASVVFAAAVRCRLINHDVAEDLVTLSPDLSRSKIETAESFRSEMQQRLCGVTDPDMDNFLLNQVVAWYAVQLPNVYMLKKTSLAVKFNQELYPDDPDANAETGRALNDTKLNAWHTWVSFLGWGVIHNDSLWPVVHRRLLPKLSPLRGRTMAFSDFMEFVGNTCPELDGGVLFEQCWSASRPGQLRGQQLSFMLSATLGTLHKLERVRLERRADALDRWQTYLSTAYPFADVTHVEIME